LAFLPEKLGLFLIASGCCAACVWANPAKALNVRCLAQAPNDGPIRPIRLEVEITNLTKGSLFNIETSVVSTPEFGGQVQPRTWIKAGQSGVQGLMDPIEQHFRVDELYAGRKRLVSLETPYYASQGFHNDFGYFQVENLVPNLRSTVTIRYRAWVESFQSADQSTTDSSP
jgi:hypothetical protein